MLPQHLPFERNGTVYIDVDTLPTAATVRIVQGDGTEQMPHLAATISTLDTGLQAAANAGNMSFTVHANTGFAVGKTAWLRDDPEEISIRQVAGTTIHLRHPLMMDHVINARVEGARISAAINTDYTDTLFFDGRCEWNIAGVDGYQYTDVECGRYPNKRLASAQDLFDCEPRLLELVGPNTDVERWLDNAHEQVLGEVAKRAPDARPRTFTGSMGWKQVTAAMAMYLHYLHQPRGDAKDDWWKEFERRLASFITVTPRDADQDGTVEASERISSRTVVVRR